MKNSYLIIVLLSIVWHLDATIIYVAPTGNDNNAGSFDLPLASLQKAQEKANPGDTVYVRGGTYSLTESDISRVERSLFACITFLDKSGESGKRINYWAYPGERPVFNFSEVKPSGQRVVGIYVAAAYLHIKGFEMTGIQVTIRDHTESYCIYSRGANHNIFENLIMRDNKGTGIRHFGGGHNLFLNCDAYRNHDDVSENGRGSNTDGFGCHPTPGDVGNVFRGCRAWFNSDDGFDCIRADEAITYENCQAFYNGYSPTFQSLGDGNGFKTGGFAHDESSEIPSKIPSHRVRFCLTVRNKANGFYSNHHLAGNTWYNNTAYRNAVNYNMVNRESRESDNINVDGYDHVLVNNLGYKARSSETSFIDPERNTLVNNTFLNDELTVTDADFVELNEFYITLPRNEDGSLPESDFMHLRSTSDLIDAGVITGSPYSGSAPDIGAFEYEVQTSIRPLLQNRAMLYPNPASDFIYLRNTDFKSVQIVDMAGKVVVPHYYRNRVDISNLQSGIYLMKINMEEKNVEIRRFVKM